jgi:hypothetical protein
MEWRLPVDACTPAIAAETLYVWGRESDVSSAIVTALESNGPTVPPSGFLGHAVRGQYYPKGVLSVSKQSSASIVGEQIRDQPKPPSAQQPRHKWLRFAFGTVGLDEETIRRDMLEQQDRESNQERMEFE